MNRGLIILIVGIILVGLLFISGMLNFSFEISSDNQTYDNQTNYQQTPNNNNDNYQSSDNSSNNNYQSKVEDKSSKPVETTNGNNT